MINKYIRLDAWRENRQVPAPILLVQGESLGRKIHMQLLSYDNPINLAGLTVNFYFKKPSGKEEFLPMQIENATSGKCYVEITSQACAEIGIINSAEIRISLNGGGNLRVLGPVLNIVPGMSDNGIESSNEYAALDEALSSISDKAPINSPALTGEPTAPTAAEGTNTAQIATTEYVQTEITPMTEHMQNNNIHVTAEKKESWDNHISDADIHVTAALNQKLAGFEPLKLLWSGSWESGSITVPGFGDYRYLCFEGASSLAPMFVVNYGSYGRGAGGSIKSTGAPETAHVKFDVSGTTLTLTECSRIGHQDAATHTTEYTEKINKIYGIA